MREIQSDEARRTFRDLLDEVERDPAAAVRILRYERPVAVMVPAEWYERAALALAWISDEDMEKGESWRNWHAARAAELSPDPRETDPKENER